LSTSDQSLTINLATIKGSPFSNPLERLIKLYYKIFFVFLVLKLLILGLLQGIFFD
jgi:hypothetical protein